MAIHRECLGVFFGTQRCGGFMATGTTLMKLPGSHVTPCGGDLDWQSGKAFSAADAIALGVRTFAQADIRRLADRAIGWLNVQSAGASTANQ